VRSKFLGVFVLATLFSITSSALFAHHGNAAFDAGKKLALEGTVTEWVWANPHCWLKFDVKDDKGNVVHWVAEASNPAAMISRGWNARDVKVGDEITLTMTVAKNGAPIGRVQQIILPDGRKLGGDAGNAGNAATERY